MDVRLKKKKQPDSFIMRNFRNWGGGGRLEVVNESDANFKIGKRRSGCS